MPSADEPSPFETVGLPPTRDAHALTVAQGEMVAAIPPKIVGDYEILSEIARGGMGVVFEARQRSANRVVALKMILSGGIWPGNRIFADSKQRPKRPLISIIQTSRSVYEVGEHEGRPFFSMKLASGGNVLPIASRNWSRTRRPWRT